MSRVLRYVYSIMCVYVLWFMQASSCLLFIEAWLSTFSQAGKICHYLLTLMSFKYIFLFLWNTKGEFIRNILNTIEIQDSQMTKKDFESCQWSVRFVRYITSLRHTRKCIRVIKWRPNVILKHSFKEQIWRNLTLRHLLISGSSAVNGCRQNESPKS